MNILNKYQKLTAEISDLKQRYNQVQGRVERVEQELYDLAGDKSLKEIKKEIKSLKEKNKLLLKKIEDQEKAFRKEFKKELDL